ncbi:hypothetical protein CBS101457_003659 [Exobasidium rhododendri]|nr:hypothetical protein CBS101457_003659 [Exobasidium rhododendri]
MTSMDFDWHSLMVDSNARSGHPSPITSLQQQSGGFHDSFQHSQETLGASSSSHSQPLPRLKRPASSTSPLPSIASSPGPPRQHSSPPRQARMIEKRSRNKRAQMDIKVLYTLDSHPNSTLVASLGRLASVQIVSLKKKGSNEKGRTHFGKVTLKTCLSAICMASPELMIDRKQDYILYAIDPIESYRASQKGDSLDSASTSASTDIASEKGKEAASSAFVVGKGFFTWALAEQGEGQSLVHGRVRAEYDDEDDEDEEEDRCSSGEEGSDFQGKILEITLRLKAASSTSRDQYFDRVKLFQSTAVPEEVIDSNASVLDRETQKKPLKRKGSGRDIPQSASSPVTALERDPSKQSAAIANAPGHQQQLLHLLQALQAQAVSPTLPPGNSTTGEVSAPPLPTTISANQTKESHSLSVPSKNHPPRSEAVSNLIRTLTAASPSANTERSPRPEGVSKGTPNDSAGSPILGGLTPGYEVDYLSGPSPAANIKASVPMESSTSIEVKNEAGADHQDTITSMEARIQSRSIGSNRSKQCCYNCGIRSQRSWRHLVLTNETKISFKEGSEVYDHGKRFHRACNACGLYFNKYSGVSRPEHVWREALRLKRELHQRESEKKHGRKCGCSKLEDEMYAEGWEDCTLERGKKGELSALARTKQISRTLSDACERDITRRMSFCGEFDSDQETETVAGSAPAKRVDNFETARLKDWVKDSEGNWRTKRSILENPTNRKAGRPKGIKTGKGAGRPRDRDRQVPGKSVKAPSMLPTAHEGQDARTVGSAQKLQAMTASSPGGVFRSSKMQEGEPTKAASLQSLLAQSSPVRSSHSLHHQQQQSAKTPGSTFNRARYGAPTYLLDSSPATAFQTVLNEAETDWNALCGLSPRRSPRKNPHGTHSGLNPYASLIVASPTTTSRKEGAATHAMTGGDPVDLLKLTSSSPLTRSRVKSGQYQMEDVWFSSESFGFGGSVDGGKNRKATTTGSSALTSPASPSPSPAHVQGRGVKRKMNGEEEHERHQLQPGQRTLQRGKDVTSSQAPLSTEKARKAARQARQAAAVGVTSEAGNGMDAAAAAGPFMGVADTNRSHGLEEHDLDEAGVGSPTLGRSLRMSQKSSMPLSGELHSFTLDQSPSRVESMLDFDQDWTRSSSLRELFPTPSPVKQWNHNTNSPSNAGLWQSPTSWTVKSCISPLKPTTANIAGGKAEEKAETIPEQQQHQQQQQQQQQSSALAPLDLNQHQLVRRKPLPATVEDASSSVNSVSSTPMEEEDDYVEEGEEGGNVNLMDLFEDPYGLLAASGIGLHNDAQPGLSMEDFESIELFKGVDFTQQLDFFTQMGSHGVAAHLNPAQGSSSSLKIEGKDAIAATTTHNNGTSSQNSITDFAELLKDPAMQSILATMQLSPSKQAKQKPATTATPGE